MVSLASSQYWLQYFVPLPTLQLHAGCSHFLISSCMSNVSIKMDSRLTTSGSLNFPNSGASVTASLDRELASIHRQSDYMLPPDGSSDFGGLQFERCQLG